MKTENRETIAKAVLFGLPAAGLIYPWVFARKDSVPEKLVLGGIMAVAGAIVGIVALEIGARAMKRSDLEKSFNNK